MSCKQNIYVTNTTSTSVLADSVIPLTTVVRNRGCIFNLSGESVTISDCGSNYYLVLVDATFTAPATGDVIVTLRQNGVNVTGGSATETISTASTESRSVSITAIVRTYNNRSIDSLTLVDTGVGATFTNVTMSVIPL